MLRRAPAVRRRGALVAAVGLAWQLGGAAASEEGPCSLASGPAVCDRLLESTCTSATQLPRFCPEECPFVASHPELACAFRCSAASSCFAANPELAFPNEATSLCEPCSIVGCGQCAGNGTCTRCLPKFRREADGRACSYVRELQVRSALSTLLNLLGALAVFGVVAVVALLALLACLAELAGWLPREESSTEGCGSAAFPQDVQDVEAEDDRNGTGHDVARNNLVHGADLLPAAIKHGMRHRFKCKIKDLELREAPAARRIPFWVDLTERFLGGVGLLLYHSWFPFLAVYSLLMALGTFWVFQGAELGELLRLAGLQHASKVILAALRGTEQDSMSQCAKHVPSDPGSVERAMQHFAYRACIGYFVLWLLGLLLSLAHAARQRNLSSLFWARHPGLADFALNLEGFPPEATDEDEIRRVLCEATGFETLQVSICYSYRAHRERLYQLLDKLVVQADVEAGTYDAILAGALGGGLSEEEVEEVSQWFDSGCPDPVRNSGSVFVVFRHVAEARAAAALLGHKCREPAPASSAGAAERLHWRGVDGRRHELVPHDVVSEPPDIVWDHVGVTWREFAQRWLLGSCLLGGCVALLHFAVFVPFAAYVIDFFKEAGVQPGDWVMSLAGILVMAANWIMCFVLWSVTSRVGFERTDRQDIVVFQIFSAICAANFFFNVYIMVFPDGIGGMLEPLSAERFGMQDVIEQLQASIKLFGLLIPGGLFIGYIMWPLQGFVWPLISSFLYLKGRTWGTRRMHDLQDESRKRLQSLHERSLPNVGWIPAGGESTQPTVSAREAELAFEPLGISLGHDYMGHVVQPMSCSLALFFASGVVWQVFLCCAAWSLFMIPFQRYMHLRACKRCFFTTERLDMKVLHAWGVPLSTVLAASGYWGARLHDLPVLSVTALCWLAGKLLYLLLLLPVNRRKVCPKLLAFSEGPAATVDEVSAKRLYNWHNCNPMKVLLSHVRWSPGQHRLIPYDTGKAYLQVHQQKREEWYKQIRNVQSSAITYSPLADSSAVHVPELESLIMRPIGTAAKAMRKLGAFSPVKAEESVGLPRDRFSGASPGRSDADVESKSGRPGGESDAVALRRPSGHDRVPLMAAAASAASQGGA